jgi:bifunctional UDP-N-acetylglucosamine pyrophosphorylase/glucosamine-1-phosphate N-acetyltransferase
VPDDATAVERSPQSKRDGGAKRYRELKTNTKAPKESWAQGPSTFFA